MAAVRRNIVESPADAAVFVDVVQALKQSSTGLRASELGIPGSALRDDVDLSWWDLFVIWHSWSMRLTTGGGRNAAHSGPVFLPWHRWFMVVLEFQMRAQLGLGDDDFGLPYWDWAADGDLTPSAQPTAPVWEIVGGQESGFAGEVTTGPFSPDNGFVVSIDQDPSTLAPRVTNHRLLRRVGQGGLLPSTAEMDQTLTNDVYDAEPFRAFSPGFRNDLEGWGTPGHNQVHVLVGGDMLLSTSPNDPIFFLNHCEMELAVGAGPVDRSR